MPATLTAQLNPTDDRLAEAFLSRYRDEYDTDPSYFASHFAGSCHVADSYLDVIRHGWSKIGDDSKGVDKRELRREFVLQLIEAHARNRDLVRRFRF